MRYRLFASFLLSILAISGIIAARAQDASPVIEAAAAIDLSALPVLPQVTDTAREIYALGQEAGLNPHVVSKIGDCMTASENFLVPFGAGSYDLGEYAELQPVVDHFTSSPAGSAGMIDDGFSNIGLATASGFTTVSVLDPLWADPQWCSANESPLACEYRVSQPAYALIMFGTNDTLFFDAPTFDGYMREIIDETIANHIVPVLFTFPERPEFPDKTLLFNQVIAQIAQDYDLPLINLYVALEDLPDKGIDIEEPIHLSAPIGGSAGNFTPQNLERGYTLRNLITLQALDVLREGLAAEAEVTPEATESP